jgi:peptidoglycan/LPS O-acetylase OafA/YrhL
MPWWTYATFTQNIAMGIREGFGGNFLGVTWSLAIEEQFYLVAPLLILAIGKSKWIKILIPLILLAIILRAAFPGFHTHINTIFRMDSLLSGVLVAVVYRSPKIWQKALEYRSFILATLSLMVASTALLKFNGVFEKHLFFSWFTILYSFFLITVLVYVSSPITAAFRTKFLCFFGSIAYGLYIFHQAISGLMHGWLRDGKEPSLVGGHAIYTTLISLALTILVSYICYQFFESKFINMGRKYSYASRFSKL